jgi:hypothetical protein
MKTFRIFIMWVLIVVGIVALWIIATRYPNFENIF